MLLTGARGSGKSSLVKALHAKYAPRGLRLIEVDKAGLPALPDLFDLLADADYRFIVFIDDLTFAEHEPGYASLKAALDGSLAGPADNVLIYATSNRRHLMPEYMAENLETNTWAARCIRAKPPRKKSRCPTVSGCGCRSTPWIRTAT